MPHLGNLIGSILPADVFSRYLKLKGEDYIYICGSDAHGTSYEIEAFKRGMTPEKVVKEYHERVKELLQKFNFNFTYYGSTHTEENKEITYRILEGLDENGYLEEQESENPYCEKDKMFLFDRLVEGKCPHCGGLGRGDQCNDCAKILNASDIIDPYCAICRGKVKFKPTNHLFLSLPKFQKWLEKWHNGKKWSPLAIGETRSWIQKELKPRRITGDTKWGFSVPKKGYENKTLYCWFDAPIGYIGITKEWADKTGERWEDWWLPKKNSDVRYIQFMGKDNVFFHSIFFPSMLHGSGEKWKQVDNLIASGWLLSEDVKFSKSTGTGLSAEEALEVASADIWRFVLMSLYPETDDMEFTWEEFQRRINNELADNVGNLVNRVLSYTKTNFGSVPMKHKLTKSDESLLKKLARLRKTITKQIDEGRLRQALSSIMLFSKECNVYLNAEEPWHKIKIDRERVETVLNICCSQVAKLADLLWPYIPESSGKIREWLGIKEPSWGKDYDLTGAKIGEIKALFTKIDDDRVAEIKSRFSSKSEDPFSQLDLKVAEIKSVEPHPNADKLYAMKVFLGEERDLVAGIRNYYKPEDLIGKKIVVVANLKEADIRGKRSQGMLLACEDGGRIRILSPKGKPGDEVFIEGSKRNPVKDMDIKDFQKIPLEVKDGKAVCNGKILKTKSGEVTCELKKGTVR